MTIHYGARVHYPDAADVQRITEDVIAKVSALQPGHTAFTADVIAREIRQRLCNEIVVDVDLVVSASTHHDSGTAALPPCAGDDLGTQIIIPAFNRLPSWHRTPIFRGSLPGPT